MDSIVVLSLAPFFVITCLGPLPPSNISITTFDTSTIRLSWTPTFLCREYQIDGFNVNITNINSSQRIFETSIAFQNSTEIDRLNLTDTNVLQPCTEFNFSISSVSATYGESDSSFIIGGFDEGDMHVYTTDTTESR